MKCCRASSVGVQGAERGVIIGSSQVCSAAVAHGTCIGVLHAAAVLLVLQSYHSQLGRHKQHAAYCCAIFILFDLFCYFCFQNSLQSPPEEGSSSRRKQ